MMKWAWLVVFLVVLAGCHRHRLINRSAVKAIRAVRYRDEADSIIIIYTDAAAIKRITTAINNNKPELIKFQRNCTLHIIYNDSSATIVSNGTSIKYHGVSYKMSKSMEEILN